MFEKGAWIGWTLAGFALVVSVGPARADDLERNKELVRRMVEVVNARDLDALDEIMAPDLRRHSAATAPLRVESLEEFKAFLESDFAAVPDSRQEIDLMLAEGDFVAARVTYRGTQKGAWGPFPASGKSVELPFIGILRIEDGKIAEIWVEWDNLYALRQLGHLDSLMGGGEGETGSPEAAQPEPESGGPPLVDLGRPLL